MVNEFSTPEAFIEMIRKDNYPIILDVELKDMQEPAKKLYFWKAFFLEMSIWKVADSRRIIYNVEIEECI